MNKTAIKNFAIWARNKLIADVRYRAGLVGITEQGVQTALPQSDTTTEFYDIGTATPYAISGQTALRQRRNAAEAIRRRAADSDYPTAYRCVMEEVAYTWFNRLIAVRFMEVNDYLPGRVRVLSSESGKIEPDLVTNPFDAELSFTSEEEQTILQLKQDNKLDELFRLLFIKQCNALAAVLPALFEQTEDYTELLLNLSVVDQDGVVWRLTHDIPEDDFNVEKGGQVEIIGWLYQYYNTEPKTQVFARPSGQKIKKEEIPAATQLFTPDWIVRYMVENSLGRLWLEGHPDEELRAGWKYYLDEAEQEPDVAAQLEELRAERRSLTPEDIKVIDPCMGSGHILVYAFDVLMQIYEKAGWERREAARSIVEKNLYGLDIDKRAYQLAYFAVMMKSRQYDRRFLTREIEPQMYYPGEDKDMEEFGSLLTAENWDKPESNQITLYDTADNYRCLLAGKYDVVVTNPPYMGASNMNSRLSDFIKKYYADYKSDYFSAFMMRCTYLSKPSGFLGFFSPYVWMFIQSYEKLRNCFCNAKTIETLIQFEYSAFEEATVPVCTFTLRNCHIHKNGCYLRLTDFRGGMEVQRQKTLEAIANHDCGYYYEQSADNFSKIPGSPVAYWVSESAFNSFSNAKISEYYTVRNGISTGDNEKYLRLWFEINQACAYWKPCNKGGGFRKWYGNNDYVVFWKNNGESIRTSLDEKGRIKARLGGIEFSFHKGIEMSRITSGELAFRISEGGFVYESSTNDIYDVNERRSLLWLLGYCNSTVVSYFLNLMNPTINIMPEDIRKLPCIVPERTLIERTVEENISISRTDWDSFETSWDFTRHPLVRPVSTVAEAYAAWDAECTARFNQLKANEEELNRIFIDIYGLQDELTPEVEDKDVTVRRADLGRDIRSLLSYAVGCMFGRYSLDEPGLILAGYDKIEYETKTLDGDSSELEKFARKNPDGSVFYGSYYHWVDQKRFKSFPIDADNILPLTDEAYLEDDIVTRLCQWLRVVYGENTLEENLDFIARALGNKGSNSREIIRNYFLKDLFADHCKIYQKRPIYWLFDSGKQNGFKALVYLHRYTPDTIGKLRMDYLHRLQRVYASEIERMQDMIDNSQNPREVTASTKRKEKLQKQLKECREYDEKIAHLALARIELDLDDGVKVNYEKVQTAADGKKYPVLGKV